MSQKIPQTYEDLLRHIANRPPMPDFGKADEVGRMMQWATEARNCKDRIWDSLTEEQKTEVKIAWESFADEFRKFRDGIRLIFGY